MLEEFNNVLLEAQKPGFLLKGKAISLLNCWLNLLFDFESSKEQRYRNEQLLDKIRSTVLSLLKDESAIASVWSALESLDQIELEIQSGKNFNAKMQEERKKLRIYLEVLENPLQNFEMLMFTLCRLCGSQRNKKA